MTKRNRKVANSGIRVIEMLKLLAHKPMSLNEIIAGNEDNEMTENVYSKETISKYFNTLRRIGFKIDKISNKFYLRTNIARLNLDIEEIGTLNFLKEYAMSLHRSDVTSGLPEMFRIIENSLTENTKILMRKNQKAISLDNYILDKPEKIIHQYEEYCKDLRKLKIKYKKGPSVDTYKIVPKNIIYKKNKVFLLGYNLEESRYREFLINDITETTRLPQKAPDDSYLNPICFKIKGPLVTVYVLRECEKLQDIENDYRTVLNYTEDRDNLMRRLLRYGENCEIMYPKKNREEFVKFTDEILVRYE